jgi:hypothetical protein
VINIDKLRVAAVPKLEALGYSYQGGEWVPPVAAAPQSSLQLGERAVSAQELASTTGPRLLTRETIPSALALAAGSPGHASPPARGASLAKVVACPPSMVARSEP